MSTMDWIFTGIIIILAARCFVRGFVQEVLSVAAYAVGLFSGLLFSNTVIDFASRKMGTGGLPPTAQYAIAFIICFAGGFLIMKLIEKLIREGLEAANLDIFDRVLGLALGTAEGLAIVALVLIIMEIQPFFDMKKVLEQSFFAGTLLPIIGPTITETLRPALGGGAQGTPLNLQNLFRKK
ncbi:MAG: CvpA family protein [Rectinemataceae bacterium]|nr:CvpA family protein [Rectinemataceae bacterium]